MLRPSSLGWPVKDCPDCEDLLPCFEHRNAMPAWLANDDGLCPGRFHLLSARAKLRRANVHLEEVAGETLRALRFDAENIGTASAETDRNGVVTLYRASITHYPLQLALQVGDVLNDLRACLDHVATGFVNSGERGQSRSTGFPIIGGDRQAVERHARKWLGSTWGMNDAAKRFLDRVQTHPTGNQTEAERALATWLVALRDATNSDKHSRIVGFDISARVHAHFRSRATGSYCGSYESERAGYDGHALAEPSFIIRDGDIIRFDKLFDAAGNSPDPRDADLEPEFKFIPHIGIKDWPIPKSPEALLVNQLSTVEHMVDSVVQAASKHWHLFCGH